MIIYRYDFLLSNSIYYIVKRDYKVNRKGVIMEKISKKNWALIWILGMAGQLCWNVEILLYIRK